MKKSKKQKWKEVESHFFDIDEEQRIAHLRLRFPAPSSLFEEASISKTPIFTDDFLDWVRFAMDYIPRRCALDLHVEFEDLEGRDPATLEHIFYENVALEAKRLYREDRKKSMLAYGLIALGALLFVSMMLLGFYWPEGGLFRDVLFYVFDIATTVAFWEALTILLVDKKERKDGFYALIRHFRNIDFSLVEEHPSAESAESAPETLQRSLGD